MRGVTDDERALLTHISRWGSAGYPIFELGSRKWTWGPWRSIEMYPVPFKTRKEAVASFEEFLKILADARAGRI